MEELHVNDVQQLFVQLSDVNDVTGKEAGFGSAHKRTRESKSLSTVMHNRLHNISQIYYLNIHFILYLYCKELHVSQ